MKSMDEEKEGLRPKTIKEALSSLMSLSEDFEFLQGLPESKLDWVYANTKDTILNVCELGSNIDLRRACGSENMTIDEATRVVSRALWNYFNP